MLKNIISLKEQLLAKVSFFLDPASKCKDPGQIIEEFAHRWGVCTSAEESDRLRGVFFSYQPFSSDGVEGPAHRAGPGKSWGLGGQGQYGEFGAYGLSMLHWSKSNLN